MALIDFQSRYSFYTSPPPAVDYISNTDAKGFITEKQPQSPSDYVGIIGTTPANLRYEHTGVRNLGDMSTNLRPFNSSGNPARDTFVRGSVGNFTTRYQNNADDIPSITARGFERDGVSSIIISRTAKDEFPIDDVTFSDRGIAKRRAQLGDGSKFPIGPAGQVHTFDIIRTGFSDQSRYGDIYGPESNSGLADTYTANSPIDDMYNKYKINDEAHNPFTFPVTRQPFILRGIQRDGNSDPQRWGLGGTTGGNISSLLDIPRGGPLTFGERTAFDVVRLGKFAISPKGLAYTVKQFGLQLMNPNIEGVDGTASRTPRFTQLYDPTSFIVNAASAGIGIRFDRHGKPLGLTPKQGKYERIHRLRFGSSQFDEISNNRLVKLYDELKLDPEKDQARYNGKGVEIQTLSAGGGPKSFLGIGRTSFTRGDKTDEPATSGNRHVDVFGPIKRLGYHYNEYYLKRRLNTAENPYLKTDSSRGDVDEGAGINYVETDAEVPGLARSHRIYHDSLKNNLARNELWLDHSGITSRKTSDENKYGGGVAENVDESGTPIIGKRRFASMNYELIREIAKDRTPDSTEIIDFVDSRLFQTKQSYELVTAYRYKMYEKAYDRYDDTSRRFGGRTEDDDLILVRIGKGGSSYPFHAYIQGLSDSFNPNYDTSNDVGVALPRYQMSSYTRTISLELQIAAENSQQLHNIWENIRGAAGKTLPSSKSGGGFSGQSTLLTVGRLYRELSVVMTSCTCNWDNETLWDIDTYVQLPMYGTIAMEFEVLSTGIAYPNIRGGKGAFYPAIWKNDRRRYEGLKDRVFYQRHNFGRNVADLTLEDIRRFRGQSGTRTRPFGFESTY